MPRDIVPAYKPHVPPGRSRTATTLASAGGAIAGFIMGGPLGAVAGGALGGSAGRGMDIQAEAAKTAAYESMKQSEIIRGQALRAEEIAKKQLLASQQSLQQISKGRVRAASRRARGGLFGDMAIQQYGLASKLGG